MLMTKFRPGDRVRTTKYNSAGSGIAEGREFTVTNSGIFFSKEEVYGYPSGQFVYAHDCELVEPLKLEVGATVTIGDGKDEWLVTRELPHLMPEKFEINRPGVTFWAHPRNLTVVKPPKPDYYVNCKGAEPKNGDVFTCGGHVVTVEGSKYRYLGDPTLHSLSNPGLSHASNAPQWGYKRTLVARGGQPYTGNV